MAGALAGGYPAGVIPEDALLLAIAAVLLFSGVQLLRGQRSARPRATHATLDLRAAVLSGLVIGLLAGSSA